MLFTIFSVFYVLVAAAMIVLILMQRGDGANAGASFGGGASGTVFGARGAASFLTRTTAALATIFFLLSLGMGIYLSHNGVKPNVQQTLGVMAGAGSSAPASSVPAASAPAAGVPASSTPAPQSEVPAAPSSAQSEVPAAPKASAPASSAPASSGPAGSH
ncbi:MAG TPA: preprotein translocase subunit SecG [Rhodanobacteraceae bacterium]|jgi:preprotein translocase subunit SecG|nr:preprotein translocase subunit SecG [Rhodanobacteraceae bacterium]